ncbi:hypothetical protein SNK03_009591 [Fusarium graminearum]|uniref:hypothetical protein n=1 Tax=Gibberella zeae (strain ATCC MYA-4620 / CBS 123657 / FGSC 9075 / NRRL 31084 / PH-1) TaxID=229533 RepID=UPI000023CDA6|nr:hypothetical protein FGSG_09743 [Fusarium graminearum PH-1]ESU16366.1 hypothetical protein FGSG_09743 [Fusarium graminearum PH-1]|eukprot:XP_011327950.1 hypothetical protein FGSG_09743 [Fusarium graminearum PH-1]
MTVRRTTQAGLLSPSISESRNSQPATPMIRDYAFSPGYLGFTSYNSAFQGARESLSVPATSLDSFGTDVSSPRNEDICLRRLPLPTQQMCLVVLQYLPGRPEAHMVFHDEPGLESTASWSHAAVSRIITSLRQLFQRFDGSESFDEEVADFLCRNTTRPVQDTFDNFDDWIAQFCGPNIRWESLGLLWAHVEGLSDALSTLKYRQLKWVEGKQSSVVSHEHLHYIIEISRHFTAGNDMLLDLCRRHAALATLVYGDASPVYWNAHSLCVSMLLFLGRHAPEASKSQGKPEKISFCVENRRFLYCYIFANDKSMVSFTGRPPLLSRRYCSSQAPLDFSDSCMISKESMTEEFKGLDERGWNTKGEIHANGYIRARFLKSYLMDEVIEIALGNDVHVTLIYLEDIKARVNQLFFEMPSHLIFDYQNLDDPDLDINILYLRILIYLSHKRDIFVVERLLLQHGAIDDGSLLTTSFDLVKVTVVLWVHKNKFAPMRRNFEWVLVAYAAPGGGILCQELLRPTFFGIHPLNPALSRSSIVQQLSMLVAFLNWVGPDSPNRVVCSDCETIIQRVLDEHLNASPTNNASLELLGPGFPRSLGFKFELLNTFEWLNAMER